MIRPSLLAALLASTLLPAQAFAQNRFATQVVAYNPGGGGGVFDTANILGGPQGAGMSTGSLDVLTLGTGGDVTVGFDVTLTDGPGADLVVFENGFVALDDVYAEVCRVEVSTDGVIFARFPCRYRGPAGPVGIAPLPWGSFSGLPGATPVLANVFTNTIDPLDPVVAGGDALDLAELRDLPEVTSGAVDLGAIHFVRLLDVVGGTQTDDAGTVIWDSDSTGSADLDALGVLQHTGNQDPGAPTVDLWRDDADFLHLVISDPDGLGDLDSGETKASVNLIPVSLGRLLELPWRIRMDTLGIHAVSSLPMSAGAFEAVLAVSVRDWAGNASSDQLALNP